ncbi:hypothetical protein [Candidatus Stoquefichus sp. SB1]|uniref:hypothetical protein n=1 Tax=Candidatus Stoquefichus sp. SB1 TaxID=1658109 RepID=UPI00067F3D77|nr:hypothetical protein [Candidatus Stoquefichus sp. SB1]
MKEVKWIHYLTVSLISFLAFMLELFSIFVLEKMIFHFDIWNYTVNQRSLHCLMTAGLWAVFIIAVLVYTQKRYHFPIQKDNYQKILSRNWINVLICLIGCKIMTFIDWHTFKVIGEMQNKTIYQFSAQYIYYFFEVALILMIIIYGQKAIETYLHRESSIPFGGIILALTWGVFHFVSRGVGIEVWNGISCMIFSILGGFIYLNLKRKYGLSYLIIAIGYLL